MKLTQREFPARAAQLAREAAVFFFCGPDEAGALAAAGSLVGHLPDAGERIDLSGADLRNDPARLGDEARSRSLFGGARHILARVQGDDALEAIKILIETGDAGAGAACPVLVHASGATDKARTAKLLEGRPDAAVVMFWPPDLRTMTQTVRQLGDAAGVRLGSELAEQIARACSLDVRLAQSEVEKLALYLDASAQSPRTASADDLRSIGAAVEEEGFLPLVNAVLSGDLAKLPGEMDRLRALQLNPVGVCLAFERRVAQLFQLAGRIGPHGNVAQMLEAEQKARRIFWRDRPDLEIQLRRWQGTDLLRLIERIALLHRALMRDNRAADVLLAQELTMIAKAACRRRQPVPG
ncbi:DNA polymerase III subunit delta [Porphyrobacter sp. GA68]|uniref:DNA polymerase III subunit delta n=1 Tax=Porphyrobacter sp. GA68 TaxID=2883480 RepID=UPI001D189F36|nr:DNA polymerase III subunit delta [Porphyrobacter sp. GA68]